VLIGEKHPLLRLGVGLFFAQSAFNIYGATLPLYFAGLGFDPTLIGLLIGATGIAELVGGLLYPWLGFHGLLQAGALLCCGGILALLRDRVTMQPGAPPHAPQARGVGQAAD
jgi:MFS family permease